MSERGRSLILRDLIEGPRTARQLSATSEAVRSLELGGLISTDGEARRGAHRRLRLTQAGLRALGYFAPWERSR